MNEVKMNELLTWWSLGEKNLVRRNQSQRAYCLDICKAKIYLLCDFWENLNM